MTDDSPTPKASSLAQKTSETKPLAQPVRDELAPQRGHAAQEFDELYDITESESEEVEIRLSNSIKRRMNGSDKIAKYPSLVIPSPRHWPTIEKFKTATPLSPPIRVEVPGSLLQKLAEGKVPSKSLAPSLDGSASGDELASLSSCPSTPDVSKPETESSSWEIPLQLDPASLSLLQQLSPEDGGQPSELVIEVQMEAVEEMRQITELPSVLSPTRINTTGLVPATAVDEEDELSALSIPSPGGFFASLNTAARHTWTFDSVIPSTGVATEFYDLPFRNDRSSTLPTSTAATFYDVPWRPRNVDPSEQILTIPSSTEEGEDPITAKKGSFSPTETVKEVDELDEQYGEKLEEKTAASYDRTVLWITSQDVYMQAVCKEEGEDLTDAFADIPDAVPQTPEKTTPAPLERDSPGKKSVRFADCETDHAKPGVVIEAKKRRISPIHDGTFWEGWRHTKKSQRARDVFQHRQARAEAEHVKRTSCQKQHAEQLKGNYGIVATLRPEAARPISFLPDATEDEKKEALQQVERERQALDQMSTSSWHVSAQREINGGRLITSPIVQTFKARDGMRILDLHGQVHCSWAWNVAMEHPHATICTAAATDAETHVIGSSIDGPDNHVVCTAARAWELPFDDASFDIISARHLHAHLRTVWPAGCGADEWDLTLRECLRVLKPGGYLEFHLLDAELLHPAPRARALGVEFAFNLRTRGYDPAAGRAFLPRLKRAGFAHIKRAWMVLPVADVQPRWVDKGKISSATAAAAASSTCISRPSTDTVETKNLCAPAGGSVEGQEGAEAGPPMGSTRDVRAVTGLVGARMWEQWHLKLSCEMGWSEERCLEGVAKALQECGRGGAAWKCLVGWARKGE